MNKCEYRAIMQYKRNQLTEADIIQKSKTIVKRFTASQYYKDSQFLMSYVNTGSEVVTIGLIEQIFRDNKRVAVPLCLKKTKDLIACEINSITELSPGTLGILEPIAHSKKGVDVTNIDIVIIPALTFDRNLNRLGHGAGYYDRFLSQLSERTLRVGFSYDFQLIDKLPKEKHDMRLDIIVTESGLITANKEGRVLL